MLGGKHPRGTEDEARSLYRACTADSTRGSAGGDGTINEVINGLTAGTRAQRGWMPLGIIPLGTANVLARDLGIPVNDIPAACSVIRAGQIQSMDLGVVNGRRFALMAGIGF